MSRQNRPSGAGTLPWRILRKWRSSASAVENSNFFLELAAEVVTLHFEIVSSLKIQPEAVAGPEVARQPERGVSRNSSRAVHDLVDTARGHADVLRHAVLKDAERLEKIGGQHFAGVDGCQLT